MGAATAVTVGLGLAGAGLSFAQARKLASDNREANRLAAAQMAELRKRAEIKFTDELSLNQDIYQEEIEQNLQVSADLINAAQEAGPREVAALAGRIGASQTQTAEAIRLSKMQRQDEIEAAQIEEESAINQQLLAMDVAQMQDKAARDAQTRAGVASATMSGVQALGSALTSVAENAPLYAKSTEARQAGKVFEKNKGLLTKAGISKAQYVLDPAKYQNIIFNTDGSRIADVGVKAIDVSATDMKVDPIDMNVDLPVKLMKSKPLNKTSKFIPAGPGRLDYIPNPDYVEPGAPVSELTPEMMNENIQDMAFNTGIVSPTQQSMNEQILAAGGSLRPQLQLSPEVGMQGFMPGLVPQQSYDDLLKKYGIRF